MLIQKLTNFSIIFYEHEMFLNLIRPILTPKISLLRKFKFTILKHIKFKI